MTVTALGIGLTTAVSSAVAALMRRPLPLPAAAVDPARLLR